MAKSETKNVVKKHEDKPVTSFEEMTRRMERMFDDFFAPMKMASMMREMPSWGEWPKVFGGRMPSVDIINRDNEVVVKAELPGVDKDDLEVTLSGNMLTIHAETKTESKEEKEDYYRRETSSGSFSRSVTLPVSVDADKVKSSFKDGVLELTLPKIEKSTKREIKVA